MERDRLNNRKLSAVQITHIEKKMVILPDILVYMYTIPPNI